MVNAVNAKGQWRLEPDFHTVGDARHVGSAVNAEGEWRLQIRGNELAHDEHRGELGERRKAMETG